jgi:hypothetical protein
VALPKEILRHIRAEATTDSGGVRVPQESSPGDLRRSRSVLRRLLVAGVAPLAVAAITASCGASSSSRANVSTDGGREASATPFTVEAMRAAAQAFNAKYCPALAACDPTTFAFSFGTMTECMAAGGNMVDHATTFDYRYDRELTAPYAHGSTLTPDDVVACAQALDLSTCDAFWQRSVPDACRPAKVGFLPDGTSCRFWNQCLSGRCDAAGAPGTCGQCVPQRAAGASCRFFTDPECADGSLCIGPSATAMKCAAYRKLGETCNSQLPCALNLVCPVLGQRCAKPAASCDPSLPRSYACTFGPYGQYCNPATSKCEPIPTTALGEPCGFSYLLHPDKYGGFVNCAHDLVCTRMHESGYDAGDGDAAAAPLLFQCADRLLDDGEACDPDDYLSSPCRQPDSVCYQNKCQRNGGSECTAPPVVP